MVNITKTIIHDEHTQDTITLKNTLLPINKGEFIDITNNYDIKQIKGTVIRINNNIVVSDDGINYSHFVHIHVY